jgi:hypothetical protein
MRLDQRRSALLPRPSAGFVAAIAERHGAERSPWPAAQRVLRRDARASIVTHVRQLFAVLFSPQVRVLIANQAGALLRAPGQPAPGTAGTAAAPAAALRTLRLQVLATRLLERESRHSSFDVHASTRVLRAVEQANHPARHGAAVPGLRARTPERVFARPPSPTQPPPAPQPAAREAERALAAPLRGAAVALPAVHKVDAAVDLDRLTREVMRGIDERLVAHRERMGRS